MFHLRGKENQGQQWLILDHDGNVDPVKWLSWQWNKISISFGM